MKRAMMLLALLVASFYSSSIQTEESTTKTKIESALSAQNKAVNTLCLWNVKDSVEPLFGSKSPYVSLTVHSVVLKDKEKKDELINGISLFFREPGGTECQSYADEADLTSTIQMVKEILPVYERSRLDAKKKYWGKILSLGSAGYIRLTFGGTLCTIYSSKGVNYFREQTDFWTGEKTVQPATRYLSREIYSQKDMIPLLQALLKIESFFADNKKKIEAEKAE